MTLSQRARPFYISGRRFVPSYLSQLSGKQLQQRAELALEKLSACQLCPRECGTNRLRHEGKVCHTGLLARVTSCFPHFGEEDCLRGWHGSGTIFFGQCNLRCVFCQNYSISHLPAGQEVGAYAMAQMMLRLQAQGCHNINLVTPDHVIPQILEAVSVAARAGLRLPIVYNSSAYTKVESLALLDGVVDIYMPDLKVWSGPLARRLMHASNYPETAKEALVEMHRQVGPLKFDEHGLARRGVLVRHLVMPGQAAESAEILRFLATSLSPDTYVNIMGQYQPAGKVSDRRYQEINRKITHQEYTSVIRQAYRAGLWRLDERLPLKY